MRPGPLPSMFPRPLPSMLPRPPPSNAVKLMRFCFPRVQSFANGLRSSRARRKTQKLPSIEGGGRGSIGGGGRLGASYIKFDFRAENGQKPAVFAITTRLPHDYQTITMQKPRVFAITNDYHGFS